MARPPAWAVAWATRLLEGLAIAGLLAAAAFFAAHPIFSVDFHWHLRLGDVIRAQGHIPRIDLFSAVHPERPYVQFQWLWDVLASFVFELGGHRAVRVAQAVLFAASFGALYAIARRRMGPAFALLLSAFVLLLFEDRMRARPDALTLAGVTAMLPLLLGSHRQAGRRAWLFVFVLAALWANLHGGASLLVLLSMGAICIGCWLNRRFATLHACDLRSSIGLCLAAAAGLACSPTLLPGTLDWLTAVGPQIAAGNQEWLPTYSMLTHGSHPVFLLIGLGPSAVFVLYALEQGRRVRRQGRQAIDFAEWLLCAGYLVLAHQAVRNAFLCLLPLACLLQRRAGAPLATAGAGERIVAVLLALALLACSVDDAVVRGYGGVAQAAELLDYDLAPSTYPTELADFVVEAGIEGGILNDGRWGGYLIWRTWPACGVFVDTRHHLTPAMWQLFRASHSPLQRHAAAEVAFRRYGLELTAFGEPTFPLVRPPRGFQLLFKAGDQELYQHRSGRHYRENLRRAAAWARRQGVQADLEGHTDTLSWALIRAGAQRWLAAPFQQRRLARAQAELQSRDSLTRARGHRARGRLRYQAGDYARAIDDFALAARLQPSDPRPAYYTALAHFALGHEAQSRAALAAPALHGPMSSRLSAEQRARLGLLARRLSGGR